MTFQAQAPLTHRKFHRFPRNYGARIPGMGPPSPLEGSLLTEMNAGRNVRRNEYERVDTHVECTLLADSYSGRSWCRAADYGIDVECEPVEHEIAWVADDLRSRT